MRNKITIVPVVVCVPGIDLMSFVIKFGSIEFIQTTALQKSAGISKCAGISNRLVVA